MNVRYATRTPRYSFSPGRTTSAEYPHGSALRRWNEWGWTALNVKRIWPVRANIVGNVNPRIQNCTMNGYPMEIPYDVPLAVILRIVTGGNDERNPHPPF